jgi:hypothetical protein
MSQDKIPGKVLIVSKHLTVISTLYKNPPVRFLNINLGQMDFRKKVKYSQNHSHESSISVSMDDSIYSQMMHEYIV